MNKVYSSFLFKAIERFSVKGIGLIISVFLARLLATEDFGQIAILTVFINLSQMVIQSGFNTALVQTKEIRKEDYSTVFYISVAIAAVCVLLIYVGSPLISTYYDMPSLVKPLRVYAFVLFFGAFNSVQLAKLQREMRFKQTMICSLIATATSGVIGIAMAYFGFGLWSLVVYNMSTIIMTCVTMVFVTRWVPEITFSLERAKKLFQYGWKMLISAVLCTVYTEVRSLIIGKKFNSDALGQYNRGQQFPNIVSSTIDTSIQSVMFPELSRAQEDLERLKALLKKSVTVGAYLIFPAMVGLACIAKPLICILMTEKWLPAVEYMRFICVAEANIALTSSNLVAIKSTGRSDIYMKLEVMRRISMIAILLISVFAFDSVKAIAIGYVISSWVDVIIVLIPMKKILNYGFNEQFTDLLKIIAATIMMGIFVGLISLLNMPMVALLFVQMLVGIVAYIFASWLFKIESFILLKSYVKRVFRRR